MKKNLLLALCLIIQLLASAAIAGQNATDDANTLQIKLPDGLYLYQPWTNWQDYFSPLLIIENNKLIDPYALLKKPANKSFGKKYLNNRKFNVFVGKEPVGKLSGITLQMNDCDTDEFLSFYIGKGIYEGGPLPAVADPAINFEKYTTLKAIAAPGNIGLAAVKDAFIVTEEDRTLAKKAIEQNLVAPAIKRIEKSIEKLHNIKGHVTNNEGRLFSLIALDIDNNGKKDLLGIYNVFAGGIPKPDSKHTLEGFSEMLFVLWDTGKIEEVMSYEYAAPAFSLVGLIDIDMDGVYELIVQKSVSTNEEPYAAGTEINILRHDPSGWKNIYRSGDVCADMVH